MLIINYATGREVLQIGIPPPALTYLGQVLTANVDYINTGKKSK